MRLGVAFATCDVGLGTHAAGNNSKISLAGANRPFTCEINVLTKVVLQCDVVVVVIDRLLNSLLLICFCG